MKSDCKAIIVSLSLVMLLSNCKKRLHEPIYIPDKAFLDALIESGLDTNGDGWISYAEAEDIYSLDIGLGGAGCTNSNSCDSRLGVQSVEGIEAFTDLLSLWIVCTEIENLDLTNNPTLEQLYCPLNRITNLDISNNPVLSDLQCGNNQLTSLDVSNNPALSLLQCYNNQLTSLDILHNPALTMLQCDSNQLISLDVSHNTSLDMLTCSSNQLTSLDVSNNLSLTILACSSNQLTTLDISNNTALYHLELRNMPSLFEVCVWETPFPPGSVEIDTAGSPNVHFTTVCGQ